MQIWQQRVLDEKAELDTKMTRLRAFISSGEFIDLPRIDQARLRLQHYYMTLYSNILFERIETFNLTG